MRDLIDRTQFAEMTTEKLIELYKGDTLRQISRLELLKELEKRDIKTTTIKKINEEGFYGKVIIKNLIKNYSESIWIAPAITFVLFVLVIISYLIFPVIIYDLGPPVTSDYDRDRQVILGSLLQLSILGNIYSIIYKLFKRMFMKSILCAVFLFFTFFCAAIFALGI